MCLLVCAFASFIFDQILDKRRAAWRECLAGFFQVRRFGECFRLLRHFGREHLHVIAGAQGKILDFGAPAAN